MLHVIRRVGPNFVWIVGDAGARPGSPRDIGGDSRVRGGQHRGWRAAARGGLLVDDFTHTAMFKQQMLIRVDLVEAGAELLRYLQRGRRLASVLNAGVPIGGDPYAQVQETCGRTAGIARNGEAEIRGQNGICGRGCHVDLDCTSIQCQQERRRLRSSPAACGMQGRGTADQNLTTA